MAQLALGLAGAAVGSMFGMPGIGFSVGVALGGYLTQPDAPDGPRINDRKLQNGQYGMMLPIVYGRERLAGTVIDQTDLTEHEHHSSGKGQSGPTSFTYTASYDVAICDGPILGILRIWADGRLVYDLTGATDVDNSKLPIAVYLGTEDQDIDPTFEAIHGVGNVSAYLGTAHIVFTDHDLADFYNRIPSYEFEVFTSGGDLPWRVSTFDAKLVDTNGGVSLGGTLEGGIITIGQYYNATPPHRYTQYQYTTAGDPVGSITDVALPLLLGLAPHIASQVSNRRIAFCYGIPGTGDTSAAWYVDGALSTIVSVDGGRQYTPVGDDSNAYRAAFGLPLFQNNFIYAVTPEYPAQNGHLCRWPCPAGIPANTVDVIWTPPYPINASNFKLGSGDNQRIYLGNAVDPTTLAPDDIILWEFTEELEVTRSWTKAELPADVYPGAFGGQFIVYHGMYAAPGGLVDEETFAAWDMATWELIGEIPIANTHLNNQLENGLVLGIDGVYSLDRPTEKIPLFTIVDDLCRRGELATSQYDTSELVDLVTGFKLTRQGTLRSSIETLIPAYAFSGVERDTLIAFPKRGRQPAITIPDGDLAATDYGSEQPAVRDYVHGHGDHLPRQVTVVYEEETADYQPGAQQAQRTVGDASSPVSMEFAIAMTAPEARTIAERALLQAHVERDAFSCATSRKYLYLEPTDVVELVDRTVMLAEKEHTPSGLVTWKSVACVPQIYTGTNTGTITGSAGGGFQPSAAVPRQLTELVLLDIASGTPFGFTAAMGKTSATGGSWPGATLYKSIDGGINWVMIASTSAPDIIGAATSVLGDYVGDLEDVDATSSVDIQLTDVDRQLSSVTPTALANGANLCAIRAVPGWEILQFQDAELIAPGKYTLTNFMRARRGTVAFLGIHAVGDTFVLLPAISVDAPEHELNVPLLYKAVTSGMTLAETPQQEFTNTGGSSDDYFDTINDHLPIFTDGGDSPLGVPAKGLVPAPGPDDCADGKFLSACGTWEVPDGGGSAGLVTTYTSPGSFTWTKPAGITTVRVILVGGGGGGGAGSASNTSNGGGAAGGGGGARREVVFDEALLGATETIVIGTGGTGGTAVTSTLSGVDGTAGGNSSFGSVSAFGGGGGAGGSNAFRGGGGGGGIFSAGGTSNTASGFVGAAGLGGGGQGTNSPTDNEKPYGGAPGAQSNTGGSGGSVGLRAIMGAMGGAAGGGGSSNTSGGSAANQYGVLAITGGTAGNPGTSAAGTIARTYQGAGGGGGGGKTSGGAVPGGGGAGQQPGGGGGGGGGTNLNTHASGAGGKGGDGIVVVITM